MNQLRNISYVIQFVLQRLAVITFALAAIALLGATIMASLGQWAWADISLRFDGAEVTNAGMYAQIGLTVLATGLLFFLPSNHRVMQLENSHRSFSVGMQDVARAYGAVHAADRASTFQLSSEFDSVRERIAYLRDHPDLSTLEPQILEMAAQMSHVSAELAAVYSDDKIARARDFLKQRQEEVETFNARLTQAKSISTEMKHWLHEVDLEESVAAAQLTRLRDEMNEILPELGRERTVNTVNTAPDISPDIKPGINTPAGRFDTKEGGASRDNPVIEMPPKAAE
ncbi:MAG: DNA repair protein [Sulfitobacter sp.]